MAISNSLPLIAFITFFLLMLVHRVHSSDSISFNFNNFGQNPKDLILQGDAHIPSSGSAIQLTKTDSSGRPVRSSVGRVLYDTPVRLADASTARRARFETSFTFELTSPTNNPADGFAFFIAPANTAIPPNSTGGVLGLFSHENALNPTLNQVVAVEFDTFVNNWDPSFQHIGINVDSIRSLATRRWQWRNASIASATITYSVSGYRLLRLVTSYLNQAGQEYVVSYVVDLRWHLPEWGRVGFAASTGEQTQIHRILSWSFSSRLEPVNGAKEEEEGDVYNIARDA